MQERLAKKIDIPNIQASQIHQIFRPKAIFQPKAIPDCRPGRFPLYFNI